MARYQVVGDCAHVVVDSPAGPVNVLLYKPALLPAGVKQDRIDHLLSVGLIAKVGDDEPAEVSPADDSGGGGETDGGGDGEKSEADAAAAAAKADVDVARAAARAKLPQDGSAPKGNASHEVWVEYAVVKGYDYEAARGESRDDLVKLLTS